MTSKRRWSRPAAIKMASINIEGFSTSKSEIRNEKCLQNKFNVIYVQQTYWNQNSIHSKINNMRLVLIPHNKYENANFIKQDNPLNKNYTNHNDIEILTI